MLSTFRRVGKVLACSAASAGLVHRAVELVLAAVLAPLTPCAPHAVRLAAVPQRALALQVELCLPRLIASCAWGTLAAFGLSAGVLATGPVHPVYSSEPHGEIVRWRLSDSARSLASAA